MHQVVHNDGSGHCMFYAIAQGIIHKKKLNDDYKSVGLELRRTAVDSIRRRIKKDPNYEMIISVLYASEKNLNFSNNWSIDYANWMSNTGWGGDVELKALEKHLHKINISGVRIYYADIQNGVQRSMNPIKGLGTRIKKLKHPVIKIILHDVGIGGTHYEYVYKINRNNKRKCM